MRLQPNNVPKGLIQRYRQQQIELAERVVEQPLDAEPTLVAAVDLHFAGEIGVAVAVLMDFPALNVLEQQVATQPVSFPYIPGMLSFREAPVCLTALRSLTRAPDLILADGQGRAHPRRFGLACHIGIEIGRPTIGVAKSILTGRAAVPDEERGSIAPLMSQDELIGMAVRTRSNVAPVYVSVGHLITLDEAVHWTLATSRRYRLPEPSHMAHKAAQVASRELRETF